MVQLPKPPVRTDIVEEHFDELDFLWELREGVVLAPDWDLHDLAELEERAAAHLDGLVLAQGHAAELALPACRSDRSAATAAAMVLFALGEPELEGAVLEALAEGEPDVVDGVRIGLRHSEVGASVARLRELVSSGEPVSRVAALDVLAFHRVDPGGVRGLLTVPAPWLATVLEAVARLGGPFERDDLRRALDVGDLAVSRAAWRAAACLGVEGTLDACRTRAGGDEPDGAALELLGVIGDAGDLPRFERALSTPARVSAVVGLGALGAPASVPWLIAVMRDGDDAVSAAAAEAFARITGAEVPSVESPAPPDDALDEEDDLRDSVVRGDPERARTDWAELAKAAPAGPRWQEGRALHADTPPEQIDALQLAFRADAYLARAARGGGPMPELSCRARIQLGSFRSTAASAGLLDRGTAEHAEVAGT